MWSIYAYKKEFLEILEEITLILEIKKIENSKIIQKKDIRVLQYSYEVDGM